MAEGVRFLISALTPRLRSPPLALVIRRLLFMRAEGYETAADYAGADYSPASAADLTSG
jgi:hypothetical protein